MRGGGGGRRGPARRGGSLGGAGWGTAAEMMPVSGKGLSSRRRLPGLAPLCRAVGRLAFSCGAGGGGWSARRRRHPRLCPGQPGQRATVLRRRRQAPRRGWGRWSPPSLASGGTRPTPAPPFSEGLPPPSAGRAALGVAPAVTGRGPRPPGLCPPVCLTGLLPRPPAPSCARGSFGRGRRGAQVSPSGCRPAGGPAAGRRGPV